MKANDEKAFENEVIRLLMIIFLSFSLSDSTALIVIDKLDWIIYFLFNILKS